MKRSILLWGRRLHLGLALLTLLPLASLALSGLALVYAPHMEKALWPEQWRVAEHRQQASLNAVVSALERRVRQPVNAIYLHADNEAWQLLLADGRQANVDPGNGAVLRLGRADDFFYGWLLHWHRRLLTGPALQPWTTDLLSVTSLVLIANLLIGLLLWLIPGARRKRLRLRRQRKARPFNYQWHSVPALILSLPLALVAITGVSFHWPASLRAPLTAALAQPLQGPDFHVPAPAGHDLSGAPVAPDWDGARALAQQALPAGQIKRLHRASASDQPLRVRVLMPGEAHPYSWVWLDHSGRKVLGSFDASQANLATRLWNLRYKIHVGDFAGPVVLASWLLVAALPLLLIWTGVRLWWLRRVARLRGNRNRERTHTPAALATGAGSGGD